MGCGLDEVWDVKEYVTGLEVSPTGRCSLFEGLRVPQSSDHLEQTTKELWRAAACFWGAISITSSAYSKWFIVRLLAKSLMLMIKRIGSHTEP